MSDIKSSQEIDTSIGKVLSKNTFCLPEQISCPLACIRMFTSAFAQALLETITYLYAHVHRTNIHSYDEPTAPFVTACSWISCGRLSSRPKTRIWRSVPKHPHPVLIVHAYDKTLMQHTLPSLVQRTIIILHPLIQLEPTEFVEDPKLLIGKEITYRCNIGWGIRFMKHDCLRMYSIYICGCRYCGYLLSLTSALSPLPVLTLPPLAHTVQCGRGP